MTCRDIADQIEAVASGDLPLDAAARAHIETCPACASALATARRIESYLATREAVAAPTNFTSSVLQKIRRERWRSEQRVDRLFNVAIVVAALLVLSGAALLFNMTAALEVAASASRLLSSAGEELLRRAVPTMGTYLAATALLVSALGMWWWADAS